MSQVAVEQHHHEMSAEEKARSIDNQKFAMWLFIASETVIFSTMIVAYIVFRIQEPEIVKGVHEALGLSGILLVTFNSFLLLTSSWAMVMGLREIQRGNRAGMIRWFWLVAGLGVAFLAIQYYEYVQMASKGITLYHDPSSEFAGFGMRFYAPTAFHGAHVFAGVLWCLLVMRRASKGVYDKNSVGVEIFGLYWHYVDIVWVLLFTLIYLI
ncbi:MAG: heme-copper oxidase subunit III [Anaerolineaceae bacterium]|nr:MAG: heme-copper oxidase subunit III [Anaerolineaceae bacterium]